jgi:hypothetical protein
MRRLEGSFLLIRHTLALVALCVVPAVGASPSPGAPSFAVEAFAVEGRRCGGYPRLDRTPADAGHSSLESPAAGDIASETLVAMGFGGRRVWRENLSVSFDCGHEPKGARAAAAGGEKCHLALTARY